MILLDVNLAACVMPRHNCEFQELRDGSRKGYACDNCIDITRTHSHRIPTILQVLMLLDHAYNCIEMIEDGTGCDIECIYFGKTYVEKRKNKDFDHMDPATWKLDGGINGRWRVHRSRGYGRDGLVVLTVIPKSEDLALALECGLIEEYSNIPRLCNKTTKPGRRNNNTSCGYVLYMAFRLSDL